MAGAIRLSELVITVSPTYASEILTRQEGAGLQDVLQQAGPGLVGILNGIDTTVWDPATDPHLAATVHHRRAQAEAALPQGGAQRARPARRRQPAGGDGHPARRPEGRRPGRWPVVPFLERLPAQLAVLGDGDEALASALRRGRRRAPRRGGLPPGLRRGPGPPAVRRRRPAADAEPLRALRPGPDAGHALRHPAGGHRRRWPPRHGRRPRRRSRHAAPAWWPPR